MNLKVLEKLPKDHKPCNIIICDTCEDAPEFDISKGMSTFKEHLAKVHRMTEMKGTKEALFHADGREHFVWCYKLTLDGGVTATQISVQTRKKDDPFRYA